MIKKIGIGIGVVCTAFVLLIIVAIVISTCNQPTNESQLVQPSPPPTVMPVAQPKQPTQLNIPPTATPVAQRTSRVTPTKTSQPKLFYDSLDRVNTWTGGDDIPVGRYDFTCGNMGDVTLMKDNFGGMRMHGGDETTRVNRGDILMVVDCKVFGPK